MGNLVKVWEPKASHGTTGPFLARYHYVVLLLATLLAGWVAFGPTPEGLTIPGQRVLGGADRDRQFVG